MHEKDQRIIRWLLYAVMVVLLAYSVVYYRLRIFSDTSGYITDMLRNDGFAVSHSRYVCILNQWLPALLIKAGASLRSIIIAYSFGYSLVPVLLSFACVRWLRRPYHALAILLQVTLMNSLLFFYTVSEFQSGLCLLLFFDALVEQYAAENRYRMVTWSLFLIPTIVFSHPMMVLVFSAWLVIRIVMRSQDWRRYIFSTCVFIIAFLIKKLWFTEGYELQKAISWEIIRPFGLKYYSGPFFLSFYHYLLSEAFLVPVLLAITLAMLLWLRKYLLAIMLILCCGGFVTLVIMVFEDFNFHVYDHYYEHYMQAAVFFLLLLFAYALAAVPVKTFSKALFLLPVFIVSFSKISSGATAHYARQHWLERYLLLMDSLHIKKAVSGRVWIPDGVDKGTFWSAHWETLILSSLDGAKDTKTLFLAWNTDTVLEPVTAPDEFVGDARNYKQSELPKRYFLLDNRPYTFLNKVVPDSVLEHLKWR